MIDPMIDLPISLGFFKCTTPFSHLSREAGSFLCVAGPVGLSTSGQLLEPGQCSPYPRSIAYFHSPIEIDWVR